MLLGISPFFPRKFLLCWAELSRIKHLAEQKSLRYHVEIMRIRDVYPESWILIFSHPGSRISDPESNNKRENMYKLGFSPF
jgi:hypothetical protein